MYGEQDVCRTGSFTKGRMQLHMGAGWMLETQERKFKGLVEPEGGRTEGRQAIGER